MSEQLVHFAFRQNGRFLRFHSPTHHGIKVGQKDRAFFGAFTLPGDVNVKDYLINTIADKGTFITFSREALRDAVQFSAQHVLVRDITDKRLVEAFNAAYAAYWFAEKLDADSKEDEPELMAMWKKETIDGTAVWIFEVGERLELVSYALFDAWVALDFLPSQPQPAADPDTGKIDLLQITKAIRDNR